MSEKKTESNQEELRQKAMEHDMTDAADADPKQMGQAVEEGVVGAYHRIEDAVVGGYKAIEDTVVGGYKAIEGTVVDGFGRMTDAFVGKFFAREGESVEEAKKRLNGSRPDHKQE